MFCSWLWKLFYKCKQNLVVDKITRVWLVQFFATSSRTLQFLNAPSRRSKRWASMSCRPLSPIMLMKKRCSMHFNPIDLRAETEHKLYTYLLSMKEPSIVYSIHIIISTWKSKKQFGKPPWLIFVFSSATINRYEFEGSYHLQ